MRALVLAMAALASAPIGANADPPKLWDEPASVLTLSDRFAGTYGYGAYIQLDANTVIRVQAYTVIDDRPPRTRGDRAITLLAFQRDDASVCDVKMLIDNRRRPKALTSAEMLSFQGFDFASMTDFDGASLPWLRDAKVVALQVCNRDYTITNSDLDVVRRLAAKVLGDRRQSPAQLEAQRFARLRERCEVITTRGLRCDSGGATLEQKEDLITRCTDWLQKPDHDAMFVRMNCMEDAIGCDGLRACYPPRPSAH